MDIWNTGTATWTDPSR